MHTPPRERDLSETGRRCLSWWHDVRRRTGRLPGRRQFDPAEFGPLLPYFFLVDVEAGPRFTFRLAGGYFTEIWRSAIAGMRVDAESFGAGWQDAFDAYREAATHGAPVLTAERIRAAPWPDFDYRILLLPLSSDGTAVDTILGAFDGDARAGSWMELSDAPSRDNWRIVAARRIADGEIPALLARADG